MFVEAENKQLTAEALARFLARFCSSLFHIFPEELSKYTLGYHKHTLDIHRDNSSFSFMFFREGRHTLGSAWKPSLFSFYQKVLVVGFGLPKSPADFGAAKNLWFFGFGYPKCLCTKARGLSSTLVFGVKNVR